VWRLTRGANQVDIIEREKNRQWKVRSARVWPRRGAARWRMGQAAAAWRCSIRN
jgi:hypothetical protein